MTGSRRAIVVPAVLVACLVPGIGACGSDCRSSSTAVVSVSSTGSITAKLTSDGDPVAGKRVTFTIDSEGVSGKTGRLAGYAKTGGDGRATLVVRGGLAAFVGQGDRPTGVRVTFSELGMSATYCSSKARRDLT